MNAAAPSISLPAGLQWGSTRLEPATLWITGAGGAGVVAFGHAVCDALTAAGRQATLVAEQFGDDGRADRAARARRAAEDAASVVAGGAVAVVVIASPRVRDRELARLAHEARGVPFFEIFVPTQTSKRVGGGPAEVYEVPPLPDLVVFPGPLVAVLASVIALL